MTLENSMLYKILCHFPGSCAGALLNSKSSKKSILSLYVLYICFNEEKYKCMCTKFVETVKKSDIIVYIRD